MLKKLFILTAVVAGGLFALNHVWSGSVQTAWKRAHARFERKIDPEFELSRIRDQITQLTPDMHKNIARIAEEIVAVEQLDKRVQDLQARLDSSKLELTALTDAVEKGTSRVSVNGKEYTVKQVKDKLKSCKNLERELANNKKVLEAKKAGVDAARQQLVEMRQQKEQLEVMAAEYDAQLKTLALEQTRSKIKLDDSRLAEIKESLSKLQARIDVERRKAELAEQFNAGSLTETKKPETAVDALEEAREYLGAEVKTNAARK